MRFFEKIALGDCKSQIFGFGNVIAGPEIVGEPGRRSKRLGDYFVWLGVGLETLLRIRRLRRLVCGAHGCSAPPSSSIR